MTILISYLLGFGSAVVLVVICLFSVSKVENNEKVYIYRKGWVRHKGNAYQMVGEHPFYDGERVNGRIEFKKGTAFGNPTTFAVFKP